MVLLVDGLELALVVLRDKTEEHAAPSRDKLQLLANSHGGIPINNAFVTI